MWSNGLSVRPLDDFNDPLLPLGILPDTALGPLVGLDGPDVPLVSLDDAVCPLVSLSGSGLLSFDVVGWSSGEVTVLGVSNFLFWAFFAFYIEQTLIWFQY